MKIFASHARNIVSAKRRSTTRLSARVPGSNPRSSVLCRADRGNNQRPDWVNDLMKDAEEDEDVAALLEGTGGNPDLIRERMRASMEAQQRYIEQGTLGEERPMHVEFREVDNFNLYVWFEFYQAPAEKEMEMLDEVVRSWFMLGRLGGYNTMNMQVMFRGDDDLSYFKYSKDESQMELPSLFHEMGELEVRGTWARFFVDMGTADEMALDVLINAMANFSSQYVGIKQLLIGGENADWPVPPRPNQLDDDVPIGDMIGLDPMRISKVGDDAEDGSGNTPNDGFTVMDRERLAGRRRGGPPSSSGAPGGGSAASFGAFGATGAGGSPLSPDFGGDDDDDIASSGGGFGGKGGSGGDDGPITSSGKSSRRRR